MHLTSYTAATAMLDTTVLIAIFVLRQGLAFSPMGTITATWGTQEDPTTPVPGSFSLCALQAADLRASCMGLRHNDSNPPATQFHALSGGGWVTCGLEYGTNFLVCWGAMQIGPEASQVSYAAVASGGFHVCAIRTSNSTVDCWGLITYPPRMAFASLVSGWGFSCGLTREGVAICWGDLTKEILQPANVTFKSIFAGGNTVCGLTWASTLSCWGTMDSGQTIPPADCKFLAVAGGLYHTCGIRADNRRAFCWGDNKRSQLMAPQGVRFSQITAGDFYTCGLGMDRMDNISEVFCWGNSVSYPSSQKLSISHAPCVSECGRNQYQVDQLCPMVGEKVCLDCSFCFTNSSHMVSTCGPYSDTVCATAASTTAAEHRSSFKTASLMAVFLSATLSMLVLLIATYFYIRYRRKNDAKENAESRTLHSSNTNVSTARALAMSPLELELATSSYSEEMVLGKGAFGTVYKGVLEDGQEVAIKRASFSNTRSSELFDKELQLLSRTHHSCLVNLVGYCLEEKLLVFEFMSRGSLHDNIFGKSAPDDGLNWTCRMKLVAQAARGLEYLHKYACPTIIHRDVKTANILLDEERNAHVADFGLSLFGPLGSATHLSNMTIVGTPGYLDPEYGLSMKLTAKSDVYSFGVVILEVLSSERPVDPFRPLQHIVSWATELIKDGALHAVLDSALKMPVNTEPLCRAITLALDCTRVSAKDRPSMTEVAKTLEEIYEELHSNDSDTFVCTKS